MNLSTYNFISALPLFLFICKWWTLLWGKCPEDAMREDICRNICDVSWISCWFLFFLTFGLSWSWDERRTQSILSAILLWWQTFRCLWVLTTSNPSASATDFLCNSQSHFPAFLSPVQIEDLVTFSSSDRKIKGWAAVTKRGWYK